jgi:hypothetical protein
MRHWMYTHTFHNQDLWSNIYCGLAPAYKHEHANFHTNQCTQCAFSGLAVREVMILRIQNVWCMHACTGRDVGAHVEIAAHMLRVASIKHARLLYVLARQPAVIISS